MKSRDILVSLVCIIQELDREALEKYIEEVIAVLGQHYEQYEVILIDNVLRISGDELKTLLSRQKGMRCLRLSRSMDVELALTAGLDSSIGDIIVTTVASWDPVNLIPLIVDRCKEKNMVILGSVPPTEKMEGILTEIFKKLFYRFCHSVLKLNLPRNTTYFIGFHRKALTHIARTHDRLRSVKALTNYIGLSWEFFNYRFLETRPKRKFRTFWEALNSSIDVIVTQSTRPLRFVSGGAFGLALSNLLYIAYVVIVFCFKVDVAKGWSTTSLQLSSGFAIIGLSLSVATEYLARLLQETMDRPLYYINEEINSKESIVGSEIKNVVKIS